ncbi:PfkB family carbohydrate kinase [Fredinandcohnia humi]
MVTLAEKGAFFVNEFGTLHAPRYSVKPVDSVAAGDSFNGALAFGKTIGKPLEEVLDLQMLLVL